MEPRKHLDIHFSIPLWRPFVHVNWRAWVPSRGNVIFTMLVIAVLVLTQNVWARALGAPAAGVGPSATTINYQGRLANSGGSPITQNNVPVTFTIYDAATGGNPLWSEARVVNVANGLFNVGLGDQTPGGIPTSTWNGDRYLEIMVGSETLTPRELIRSVPVAGMALTVPDGTIDGAKVKDGSLTADELNLQHGTFCVPSQTPVNSPGNYQLANFPGVTLNFSLSKTSTVLLWIDGLALVENNASNSEVYVFLNLDGAGQTGEFTQLNGMWFNLNGQRIVEIAPGSHTLTMGANSGNPAKITLHSSGVFQTCINYLVLGTK